MTASLLHVAFTLFACAGADPADTGAPCAGEGAIATCLVPQQDEALYLAQADLYFDTMEGDSDPDVVPVYSDLVARWERP